MRGLSWAPCVLQTDSDIQYFELFRGRGILLLLLSQDHLTALSRVCVISAYDHCRYTQ